jgi:hypothetical protein
VNVRLIFGGRTDTYGGVVFVRKDKGYVELVWRDGSGIYLYVSCAVEIDNEGADP